MDWINSLEPWQQVLGIVLAGWALLEILGRTVWYIWQLILRLFRWKWPGREAWGANTQIEALALTGQLVNPARLAYTGGVAQRWTSQGPQRGGMWYNLDMARPRTIQRVVFDQGRSFDDYPKRYRLALSPDGQDWITFDGEGPIDTSFEATIVRFIRLTILEPNTRPDGTPWWWSIHDIKIHERRLKGLWVAEIK